VLDVDVAGFGCTEVLTGTLSQAGAVPAASFCPVNSEIIGFFSFCQYELIFSL